MKEMSEKLNAEIVKELGELKGMSASDERRSKLIDDIAKLCRLEIEVEAELHRQVEDANRQIESDRKYISEQAEKEERARLQKAAQNKDFADKMVGHVVNVAGIVINVGAFGALAYAVMKFEETGAITSTAYKLLTRTLPIVKKI